MSWPFGDLVPMSYGALMLDCPWSFSNWSAKGERKNAKHHYTCMALADIKALPVGHLASKDAVVFVWATWPMLPQAMEVMATWGCPYVTGGAWMKKTIHGKHAFGTGYRLRSSSEPWLLGFFGNPKTSRAHRNTIEGLAREHSRKPTEAYEWMETYYPGVRRAELFARETRSGWDSWGDESFKFDEKGEAA